MRDDSVASIEEEDLARLPEPLRPEESVGVSQQDVGSSNAASSLHEWRAHGVPGQGDALEHVRISDRGGAGLEGAAVPGPVAWIVVRRTLRVGDGLQVRCKVVRATDHRRCLRRLLDHGQPKRCGLGGVQLCPNGGPRPVQGVELDEGTIVIADVEIVELRVLSQDRRQQRVEGSIVDDRPRHHGRELGQH